MSPATHQAKLRVSDFASALSTLVCRVVAGARQATDIKRLSGGASKETWSFRATGPHLDRALILRRQPPGRDAVGQLGLESEARLMQAANTAGVPSPPVLYILDPQDGLGSGFLMDHVEGETLGRRIVRDEQFAAIRPKLARQAGRILARIHAIPASALLPLPSRSAARDLDDLYAGYQADGQPRPVFELAFRWLHDHAPREPEKPRLVHGDFRNGNLIIAPDGIRAVLDWELAAFGDPVRDLGWICTASWRFGEIDKPVGGFGSR